MYFVKLTEHNDHEGESWNFWLQQTGNKPALQELATWLNTFDAYGEQFVLDLHPVPEKEVDILVKHSGQGYMNYENKVTGIFTLPAVEGHDQQSGSEWLYDNFYKGKIMEHFNGD